MARQSEDSHQEQKREKLVDILRSMKKINRADLNSFETGDLELEIVDSSTPLYKIVQEMQDELYYFEKEMEEEEMSLEEKRKELEKNNQFSEISSNDYPLKIGTVEEVTDFGIVIKRGPEEKRILENPSWSGLKINVGDRIALNSKGELKALLGGSIGSTVQTMEVEESPEVSYGDIGGLSEQIQEIREAVEIPLKEPQSFEKIGIDPPTGVLLHGPPGTGKTMLAKAVANNTNATFMKLSGSELVKKYLGEGPRLVRELFELAKSEEPAIIFIDEIDAIASRRQEREQGGEEEVRRTMLQLMTKMDGFEEEGEVQVLAATNRYDKLDEAILRPGRFDKTIEIPEPEMKARESIFQIHTQGLEISDEMKFADLAHRSRGMTGADIEAVCREAGLHAVRENRNRINQQDFIDSINKIKEDRVER